MNQLKRFLLAGMLTSAAFLFTACSMGKEAATYTPQQITESKEEGIFSVKPKEPEVPTEFRKTYAKRILGNITSKVYDADGNKVASEQYRSLSNIITANKPVYPDVLSLSPAALITESRGKDYFSYRYSVNQAGQLTTITTYNCALNDANYKSYLQYKDEYKYNDNGQVSEVKQYSADGYGSLHLSSRILYEYDEAGKLISAGYFDPTMGETEKYTYTTDEKGTISEMATLNSDDEVLETTTYGYTEDGKLLWCQSQMPNGGVTGRTEYYYDTKDYLRETVIFISPYDYDGITDFSGDTTDLTLYNKIIYQYDDEDSRKLGKFEEAYENWRERWNSGNYITTMDSESQETGSQ